MGGTAAGGGTPSTAGVGGSSASAGVGGSLAAAGGGAGGSQAAGAGGSGPVGDVVCPKAPPFDQSNAALVAKCTRPLAVAVGNALRRLSSFDGQTWQFDASFPDGGQDQNENSHRDVAVGNGVVVITGDGGVLASRDAGQTYEKVIDVRNHDSAVTLFRGAFWIVGTQLTATSTDGFTWQKWQGDTQLPGGIPGGWDTTALAGSDDHLVAITGRNNARRVFDGTTWVQTPFGASYSSLQALAFGGGKFAIVGSGCCDQSSFAGLRAASPDGTTWTVATNASASTNFRFGDVFWDGARFVATGSQYDKRTFVSSDGLAYTEQTSSVGLGPIAKLGARYVGSGDGVMYASDDAKAWTETYRAASGKIWGLTKIATGPVLK